MVSAMWEGVARMTQMARDTTHSFLDASVLAQPHPPGAAAGPAGACPHAGCALMHWRQRAGLHGHLRARCSVNLLESCCEMGQTCRPFAASYGHPHAGAMGAQGLPEAAT